jgi:hypothetical protein
MLDVVRNAFLVGFHADLVIFLKITDKLLGLRVTASVLRSNPA